MKKNYSDKLWAPVLFLFLLLSCGKNSETHSSDGANITAGEMKYTCPMHPEIVQRQPGKCPICGMELIPLSESNELLIDSTLSSLLKPVNERVVSNIATIVPDSGTRIFSVPAQGIVTYDTRDQESVSSRVAGRIEKMYIKYNFQPVKKGQLIMEIYSPDLAAAQRELIYISRNSNDTLLLQRAKQRLNLLGMHLSTITRVITTGQPVYRVPVYSPVSGYIAEKKSSGSIPSSAKLLTLPSGNSSGAMGSMAGDAASDNSSVTQQVIPVAPVLIREGQYVGAGENLFTVYKDNRLVAEFSFVPALAATLKEGQTLIFHTLADPTNVRSGILGLIEPKLANGIGFTTARIYLGTTDLKPGQLLTATIPVVTNRTYWLAQDAVLQLGTKSVVFRKEDDMFVPREVETGLRINGLIEIKDTITGWQVATNAGFLVDSESFIRLTTNNSK